MKFFSILAGLMSLIAASPLPQVPSGSSTIPATIESQYYVKNGQIVYNTTVGLISKVVGTASDVTTLITFTVPAAAVGKKGVFNLALDNAATTTVSGSALLDLFSSIKPATASAASWGPGNQRNNHLGRLSVKKNGAATWVAGFPTIGQGFTLPATAGTYGYELVGVYDTDLVSWTGVNNGLWISWS